MSELPDDVAEQYRLSLTSHPLQRVGAFALTALSKKPGQRLAPEELGAERFRAAMERVAEDAERASVQESQGADGFWQKVSHSFFPNSPMNHPGRYRGKNADGQPKTERDVRAAVRPWLSLPDRKDWPGVACVLCGRRAVGWYGKRDMVLAESETYANATPRGHEGTALCYPCLCSFYALPYGSQLTGGTSTALHSWDESFLRRTVTLRARRNLRYASLGRQEKAGEDAREVVALRALRGYQEELTAGVDLLVFNNNNRGQLLSIHHLDQPLAEWLRAAQSRGPGFVALLRAHSTGTTPGIVGLGRNAFREPRRVLVAATRYLWRLALAPTQRQAERREESLALIELMKSFALEVTQVSEDDWEEIRGVARRLGSQLAKEESGGKLRGLRALMRDVPALRSALSTAGVRWACLPPSDPDKAALGGPFMSERAVVLLFDRSPDANAWFHRELLLTNVLAYLHEKGWYEQDSEKQEDVADSLPDTDQQYIKSADNDVSLEEEQ